MNERYRDRAISKGSLDIDDLLFRCLGFVGRTEVILDPADMELLGALERRLAATVYYDDPKRSTDQRMELLIDGLFPVLRQMSPPGCFFGIHPGDPGRVGFWSDTLRFHPP